MKFYNVVLAIIKNIRVHQFHLPALVLKDN